MSELVGNKDKFGVEYSVVSSNRYVMGYMRLWIEGKSVGAFQDVNILSTVLRQLEIGDFESINGCCFDKYCPGDLYDLFLSNDFYRYVLILGNAFDDFYMYWYACGNKLNFLWKIVDNPYFEYSDSREVQFASVGCDEFMGVVSEFRKALDFEAGLLANQWQSIGNS